MLPCVPDNLPLLDLRWREVLPLVGRANAALARYDGMLQTLPNSAILLSPITANEAVLSSKIEGTQATLDEVLEAEAGLITSETRRGDIEEINNYRAAVGIAEAALADRPITLSLIREVHQQLLRGVRGRDKTPGKFRDDQNWIGRRGDTIDKARFVPPSPVTLFGALENWQDYIGLESEDPVLQTAVAHAQFEILHPFKDGNGRIGRMLIPLILYQRCALSRPMFYMSEYLEAHREDYYDRLLGITDYQDWHGWITFFLQGMIEQAEANLRKVKSIRDLYEESRRTVVELTHSQFAMAAVDAFFTRPIISGTAFADAAGFNNRVTANNMLRQLETNSLITKIRDGSGRTPAIYAFPQLINIAEGKPVFKEIEPRLL
ncbi:Fic family protein [Altericroceibacterium spongiae]|uniref:Fic family protein n=1 Tax=Altericroceibacterium spongiae TaxID=2320269 RepID=A0A420EEJ5_9SPHN|nr:Fic/DOC family N-terminal domain-containing protein [Altericroceibacterium spongiae]RKF19074.1 Fic family protein [Altericroceibacterium spongiae]